MAVPSSPTVPAESSPLSAGRGPFGLGPLQAYDENFVPSPENHGHIHPHLEPQEASTQRAVPAVSKDSLQPILGEPQFRGPNMY